jgi:hypothetical protein
MTRKRMIRCVLKLSVNFDKSLQITESNSPSTISISNSSALEGLDISPSVSSFRVNTHPASSMGLSPSNPFRKNPQPPLAPDKVPAQPFNRRTRRRLARELSHAAFQASSSITHEGKPLVELKRLMSRPPGTTFLGSRAVEANCSIDGFSDPLKVIIDSGSDITLISEQAVKRLSSKPRIVTGQRINLIQVTGNAIITGFVTLDLYFHTIEGPVKMRVEAYVVRGMTTPFFIGERLF